MSHVPMMQVSNLQKCAFNGEDMDIFEEPVTVSIAYNERDGQSLYATMAVHIVDLRWPYISATTNNWKSLSTSQLDVVPSAAKPI